MGVCLAHSFIRLVIRSSGVIYKNELLVHNQICIEYRRCCHSTLRVFVSRACNPFTWLKYVIDEGEGVLELVFPDIGYGGGGCRFK